MRDLRRQALESGKTVSKKAKAKMASQSSSAANSRPASHTSSRNASRHGSDDEDADESDSTNWSMNSTEDLAALETREDDGPDGWKKDLSDRIEEILDRKRSSIEGRELAYAVYGHILTTRYAFDDVDKKVSELLAAFLRSIKNDSSEKETFLAIRAIVITLITCPTDSAFGTVFQVIKRVYTNSESNYLKAAAIRSIGCILTYGGAGDADIEDVMDELLEIIESDGSSIDAADSGPVVVAALEEWGFLATSLDDLEERTEAAAEAFVEQLDSSDAAVQIAAGENIALLFEKSYTEREVDDASEGEEDDEDNPLDVSVVKRYDVYRQTHQLKHKLTELIKVSSKGISRKDRKHLHASFGDILNTVEFPQRGPRYQNAIDQDTGRRYGSRMTVRIHRSGVMRIDRWWKLMRLQELKRILGGGFVVHYENNEVVFDSLPIMMSISKGDD